MFQVTKGHSSSLTAWRKYANSLVYRSAPPRRTTQCGEVQWHIEEDAEETQSINQSINQSSIAPISPIEARLSSETAKSVFNSKIEETVT